MIIPINGSQKWESNTKK